MIIYTIDQTIIRRELHLSVLYQSTANRDRGQQFTDFGMTNILWVFVMYSYKSFQRRNTLSTLTLFA